MVAVIVENGTNVANANSYMAIADVSTALSGTEDAPLWEAKTVDQKNDFVIFGTWWLDHYYRHYGKPLFSTQKTQWPRTKNWDNFGQVIAPGTMPKQLKDGLVILLRMWLNNPELVKTAIQSSSAVSQLQLGPLMVEYLRDNDEMDEANEEAHTPLREWQNPDLDLTLRSISIQTYRDWITTDRRTYVT